MKRKMMMVIMAALAATMLATTAASASHYGDGGGYDGGGWYGGDDGRDGGRDGGDEPRKAVSYINPDNGAATENRDVDDDSNCSSPDRYDDQMRSAPGSTANNVHNDACFFDSYRSDGDLSTIDAPATFDSFGVGSISACPDPDGAGPKYAVLSDSNGDGRNDRCFQSGYQDKGAVGVADVAGDFQFHARVNQTSDMPAGEQQVVWGYDPEMDGVSDTDVKDEITVNWQ